jgi:hypothetical protein
MSNGHGGARPGAGRKPRAVRYSEAVASGEAALFGLLPKAVEVLQRLIAGDDLAAAKLVFAYCLGKPVPQGAPAAEDIRLPTDHTAFPTLASMRRTHATAAELEGSEETAAEARTEILKLEYAGDDGDVEGYLARRVLERKALAALAADPMAALEKVYRKDPALFAKLYSTLDGDLREQWDFHQSVLDEEEEARAGASAEDVDALERGEAEIRDGRIVRLKRPAPLLQAAE